MITAKEMLEYNQENINSIHQFGNDSKDAIETQFQNLFSRIGVVGVELEEVEFDEENNSVSVLFSDYDGDELSVTFVVDSNVISAIIDTDDDDDDEVIIIELSGLNAATKATPSGLIVDLTSVESWMNKSSMLAILQAGDIEGIDDADESLGIEERKVVRGGKVINLPNVRKRRKKKMKPSHKRALAKAQKKANRGITGKIKQRKLKKSLKIRKRFSKK